MSLHSNYDPFASFGELPGEAPAFCPVDPYDLPFSPPSSRKDVEDAQTQKPLDVRRSLDDLLEVATSAHYAMADSIIATEAAGHFTIAKHLREAREKLQAQCDAIRSSLGPRTHVLKTDPGPFRAVWAGIKRYEVRKFDRAFRVGDELKLVEHDRETGRYSGAKIRARVTAITAPGEYDLPPGVGVIGIEVIEKAEA